MKCEADLEGNEVVARGSNHVFPLKVANVVARVEGCGQLPW